MADNNFDVVAVDAFVGFSYVPAPDMPVVSTGPRKINLATVQGLMGPGEKLLSWGTLPKSTFFAFDERLVRRLLWLVALTSLLACLAQVAPFSGLLLLFGRWLPGYWPVAFLIGLSVFEAWKSVRTASYVLTDRRLMRIASFAETFNLTDFDRALQHKDADGTIFIELWRRGGEGPSVVLELALEPRGIVEMFPLAVDRQDGAPVISPAAPTAADEGG
jgi:hypothetical protein